MKNVFKLFGIIALAAIIGFSMAACGGDDDGGGDDGGGGGTFTITGIPSQYNEKYVFLNGMLNNSSDMLYGCQNINFSTQEITFCKISNGSVSLPVWKVTTTNAVRYSGNDTASFFSGAITDSASMTASEPNALVMIGFGNFAFSKGSATMSWSQAQVE